MIWPRSGDSKLRIQNEQIGTVILTRYFIYYKSVAGLFCLLQGVYLTHAHISCRLHWAVGNRDWAKVHTPCFKVVQTTELWSFSRCFSLKLATSLVNLLAYSCRLIWLWHIEMLNWNMNRELMLVSLMVCPGRQNKFFSHKVRPSPFCSKSDYSLDTSQVSSFASVWFPSTTDLVQTLASCFWHQWA